LEALGAQQRGCGGTEINVCKYQLPSSTGFSSNGSLLKRERIGDLGQSSSENIRRSLDEEL
jgi:hypothetical protein